MRTYVYVDGFNLYYGAVKGTPYKWLDLMALCRRILEPQHDIALIRYFTAIVSSTPSDPDKPIRQRVFIQALSTHIPQIRVHYGFFLQKRVIAPLANPTPTRKAGTFLTSEEKGSDVNLAVHLYRDASLRQHDCAVVVSNDSDLCEAMKLAKEDFGTLIGLITPTRKHPSRQLIQYADFVRRIRQHALADCQLPDPIPGTSIRKPSSW